MKCAKKIKLIKQRKKISLLSNNILPSTDVSFTQDYYSDLSRKKDES